MGKNPLAFVLVIVVLLVGAYGAYRIYKHFNNSQTSVVETQAPTAETPAATNSGATKESSSGAMQTEHVVTVSSSGFAPQIITIKSGEAVTWMNSDSQAHTVNSDPHPTHTLYPILNTVGRISAGTKKSLTFQTPGTYKYHDHLNPSSTGQVVVQ